MRLIKLKRKNPIEIAAGVNKFFMAPELAELNEGPHNDIWSIGTILYLLITGGVQDRIHGEKFDFNEPVWQNCSDELKEFIELFIINQHTARASMDELLSS